LAAMVDFPAPPLRCATAMTKAMRDSVCGGAA
jgi:hypothetical protein